nr:MAG TPA: hypothetical protein [Caudoviricetes sp.]
MVVYNQQSRIKKPHGNSPVGLFSCPESEVTSCRENQNDHALSRMRSAL